MLSEKGDYGAVITSLAMKDRSYRTELIADPKGVIERTLGTRLPSEVDVRILEESSKTIFLVLPPFVQGESLVDRGHDEVAGLSATHVSCCQCSHTKPDTRKECGNRQF